MSRLTLILVFLWLGIEVSSASFVEAQKLYRCDGYVQYRPCGQSLGRNRTSVRAMPRPAAINDGYPKVVRESFRKINHQYGNWRGEIKGRGKIILRLQVYRNGVVESDNFMGSVVLPQLKSTTFSYSSIVPPGTGWTWKVFAYGES